MSSFAKVLELLAAPVVASLAAWLLNHFYAGRLSRNIDLSERLLKSVGAWRELAERLDALPLEIHGRAAATSLLSSLITTLDEDFKREMHLPDKTRVLGGALRRILLLESLKSRGRFRSIAAYSFFFVAVAFSIGAATETNTDPDSMAVPVIAVPAGLAVLFWRIAYRRQEKRRGNAQEPAGRVRTQTGDDAVDG